jgi:ABC-type lipoprotein release transport system permease subunit
VAPNDPVTFIAITGLMSATATLATLLPAARASAVHPIESLRHD